MRQKLGQYFLKDEKTIQKIVAALDLREGETVVEVGAGHGELTERLKIKNQKLKLLAIEKDGGLVRFLREKFSGIENIEIIEGDALKLLNSITYNLKPKTFKVVGNIPYYLTGYLLRLIGELENKPERCVFTIQREVAERICARPPKMNKLSASVQFWAEPEIIKFLPKEIFSPPPKVDSAIIRLRVVTLDRRSSDRCNESRYYEAVRVLFKQPRKTILNNLLAGGLKKDLILFTLKRAGVSPGDRSQNLDVPKIKELARKIVS